MGKLVTLFGYTASCEHTPAGRDRLVVDGASMPGPRTRTIIGMGGADGSPPYLVH